MRAWAFTGRGLAETAEPSDAVWIDLLSPDAGTLAEGAAILGAPLPTREEMEEIEQSSRVYRAGGADYLTVLVPTRAENGTRTIGPVTFVLAGGRLATLRYHEPSAFETYPRRAGPEGAGCATGAGVLHGLVETIVDRLADILERIGEEIEHVSRDVFRLSAERADPRAGRSLRDALAVIGREGDLLGDVRMSVLTVERMLAFLDQGAEEAPEEHALVQVRRTQARDLASLAEHAGFLSQKITLVLEATLGMISIEQNDSIKIFTVVAVVFLPPTLIASVYGMNFEVMPELGWTLGYPFALALMVASAGLSWWVFKRFGWL